MLALINVNGNCFLNCGHLSVFNWISDWIHISPGWCYHITMKAVRHQNLRPNSIWVCPINHLSSILPFISHKRNEQQNS